MNDCLGTLIGFLCMWVGTNLGLFLIATRLSQIVEELRKGNK